MKAVLKIAILFCLLMTVDVHAAMITGEIPLGGITKELADKHTTVAEVLDEMCLERIVEAEVTGGTIEQKMNVVSVILNRVYNPNHFPNTIRGVVFEPQQFTPITDGRYYTVTVTDTTRYAIWAVRQFGLTTDCTYFCTATCGSANGGYHSRLKFEFFDGAHNFYHGSEERGDVK